MGSLLGFISLTNAALLLTANIFLINMAGHQAHELPQLSLIVLGDAGIGKTSMIKSYGEDTFTPDYQPTAYINYELKLMVTNKQISIVFQ